MHKFLPSFPEEPSTNCSGQDGGDNITFSSLNVVDAGQLFRREMVSLNIGSYESYFSSSWWYFCSLTREGPVFCDLLKRKRVFKVEIVQYLKETLFTSQLGCQPSSNTVELKLLPTLVRPGIKIGHTLETDPLFVCCF